MRNRLTRSLTQVWCAVLILHVFHELASGCNEAVCASIVSKCTLLKSCECEIIPGEPCACCHRCKKCLEYLFTECCSCFELCPKPEKSLAQQGSSVFDFEDPPLVLWDALMETDDSRWEKFTYPVDISPARLFRPKKTEELSHSQQNSAQETLVVDKEDLVTANCTVAFLYGCMAKNKCRNSCATMGASSYRWFDESACCECVGHHCLNYGINESRCTGCSFEDEDDDLDELSLEELHDLEREYSDEIEKQQKETDISNQDHEQ
ncbi:hypothetical protein TCAL_05873 [Tigriopus californicus]|uniref:Protein twisted gastrulation n=1 Tax=Tigriopus californicus TaxID=6832 RepID=A0A553NNW0_TIGCA|nr:protein twisted gastrulation-like [Tigriopus californicus]TRY67114.1 hypothetical protein TCAL_05873 [Tigriopus californicus]|eukprot:TCALIF_05873-PA protein Name:"Similar to tsg Protein twisted gastrulation (Drosophila melanogaster)" AED:0.02 eAED:0.02 QI:0/-1/0/1/-1/1/1/0/263